MIGCAFTEDSLQLVDGLSSSHSSLEETDKNSKNAIKQKKVDILFVVDTSYSMIHYLEQVPQSFAGFIDELSSLSWRIVFTNADYDPSGFGYYRRDLFEGRWINLELNGQVLKDQVLYPELDQNKKVFIDTLKRYEKGDVTEFVHQHLNPCDFPPYCQGQVRNPLHSLLMSAAINQHQFRRDADFVSIIFSNGDEVHPLTSDFVQRLNNILHKGAKKRKNTRIFGISIVPDDQECLQKNQQLPNQFMKPSYANSVFAVVKATQGQMMSICSSNFSSLAKSIVEAL